MRGGRPTAGLLCCALLAGCAGPAGDAAARQAAVSRQAPGRATSPPWDAPQGTTQFITAAGLPLLAFQGTQISYGVHLSLTLLGESVVVPAGIGVDFPGERISPVHTVDDTGLIRIETNHPGRFTLGEFFTEWDVRLTSSCIGSLCDGPTGVLTAVVNGRVYRRGPAGITLTPREQIVLSFGAPR